MKIYIRNIIDDTDLLCTLFQKNRKLQDLVFNDSYNYLMYLQKEDFERFNLKGVEIKDNYNSFYLKITDYGTFIESFEEFTGNEGLQAKYKKAIALYNAEDKEDDFEKACNELIEEVEKHLHTYESAENMNIEEDFIFNVQENGIYGDLYFYENDENYVLHQDITKDFN